MITKEKFMELCLKQFEDGVCLATDVLNNNSSMPIMKTIAFHIAIGKISEQALQSLEGEHKDMISLFKEMYNDSVLTGVITEKKLK